MILYDNTTVTVELGELVQSGVNVFDFEYPVPRKTIAYNDKTCTVDFDKAVLEKKIIDHYYFRQIGQETVGRFKHYLRSRMNEIMPYFVQLYEFDAKFRNIDDPLESYNLVEKFKQDVSGTGKYTGGSISDSFSKFSDTPQGEITNIDAYMTQATVNSDSNDTSSNTESSGSTEHTLTKRGNIGVQPLGGEVENIRNAFINIDMQIVEALNDLFLKIY